MGCGLARALTHLGRRLAAVKPVESGCDLENPACEDGVRLASATGQKYPREAFNRLKAPLAPPVAADREGLLLSSDGWCKNIRQLSQTHELVMVEGAGGLLSPLTWQETNLDLVLKLRAQVLVVAPNRLGVVNQALLVLRVLAQEHVPLIGIVLCSTTASQDDSVVDNAGLLKHFSNLEHIYSLPYSKDIQPSISHFEPIGRWIVT